MFYCPVSGDFPAFLLALNLFPSLRLNPFIADDVDFMIDSGRLAPLVCKAWEQLLDEYIELGNIELMLIREFVHTPTN